MAILKPNDSLRDRARNLRGNKKKRSLYKTLLHFKTALVATGKSGQFVLVCCASVILFAVGIILSLLVNNGDTYVVVLPNDAIATITPKSAFSGFKVNTNNANGKFDASKVIDETTLIENVVVASGITATEKKNITANIRIIIDKTAPVVADLTNKTWTNAESVNISGTVTDEIYSSGLSCVVWCKDSTLTLSQVLSEENNKTAIKNGSYSFDISGEQNSIYYIYAVDNAGNVSTAKTIWVGIVL